jgi:hypothetical protein
MAKRFELAIAYFRRGVIAFLGGDLQIVDGKGQICPDQLKKIQLVVLWSPEDIRFISDLVRLDSFSGIESVSDTDIEDSKTTPSKVRNTASLDF